MSLNIISRGIISLFFVLILFSSCLALKPGAVKSGSNLFESFFVGEFGTQYFIKPLLFEDKKSSSDLQIDFTFRYKNKIDGNSTVNFGITDNQLFKSIKRLHFTNGNSSFECSNIKFLFNEKKGNSFYSRFTTEIELEKLKQLFSSTNWEINIEQNNLNRIFVLNKQTTKSIERLNENLFILF